MYQKFLESFDASQVRHGTDGVVEYQIQDDVAVVMISNEVARNALSLEMWGQLERVFEDLARVVRLRAVVVRGAGTAAFAAGADISEFPENRFDSSQASRYNNQLSRALRAIAGIEIPTLAMIRGFAVGGGCELSAACDLRIGGTDAHIGIPIGRLGVILGITESKLLVRNLGVSGLKRVLFSGELFGAADSLHLGLLDEVVSTEDLAYRVNELLMAIVTSSATTMAAAKVITDLAGELNDRATDRVSQFMVETYDGDDLKEGVAAFLEKRPPLFSEKA